MYLVHVSICPLGGLDSSYSSAACRQFMSAAATMTAPYARRGHQNKNELLVNELLQIVSAAATTRGVFASIELLADRLRCHAKDCPEPAWYELAEVGGSLVVRFATPDRWLSESIETDLMHFGDPIEELIEEELAELGWRGKMATVKHFRDDDRLYTFENAVPAAADGSADKVAAEKFLFAYEAAFRALGDVGGGDETD